MGRVIKLSNRWSRYHLRARGQTSDKTNGLVAEGVKLSTGCHGADVQLQISQTCQLQNWFYALPFTGAIEGGKKDITRILSPWFVLWLLSSIVKHFVMFRRVFTSLNVTLILKKENQLNGEAYNPPIIISNQHHHHWNELKSVSLTSLSAATADWLGSIGASIWSSGHNWSIDHHRHHQ